MTSPDGVTRMTPTPAIDLTRAGDVLGEDTGFGRLWAAVVAFSSAAGEGIPAVRRPHAAVRSFDLRCRARRTKG